MSNVSFPGLCVQLLAANQGKAKNKISLTEIVCSLESKKKRTLAWFDELQGVQSFVEGYERCAHQLLPYFVPAVTIQYNGVASGVTAWRIFVQSSGLSRYLSLGEDYMHSSAINESSRHKSWPRLISKLWERTLARESFLRLVKANASSIKSFL